LSSNRLLDLGGSDDADRVSTAAPPNTADADQSGTPAASGGIVEPAAASPATDAGDASRRVAALADYGDADEGALGATVYAARVLLRRLNLRMTRQRLERTLDIARNTLDQALVPVGAALCKQQDDVALQDLALLFEAVETARRTARDKDTAREQLRASTADAQRTIDGNRANSEAAAAKLEAEEAALSAEEAQLRAKLKRAQALVQRCDIEMRAAEASVATPDPEKINELLRKREEREAEAQTISSRLAVVLADVGEARRALASARGVMSVLEGERRAKEAQHQKVDRKHAKGTAKAHHALDAAMINLASVALDKRLVDVSKDEGARASKARERTEALRAEIDDLIAADSVYDNEPYDTGVRVIGGGVGAIVIGLYLALSS